MNNPKKLYGLILAGGFSKRMGQDKALMNYHGKTQIEYVHDLLTQAGCQQVFLSHRKDQASYPKITSIHDNASLTATGPLVGILSAMKTYPEASWLVLACDLPFVNSQTLLTLIEHRDPSKFATAFKSVHDELPEPLCAIWEGDSYEKAMEFLKQAIHCPRKVLIKSDIKILDQQDPRWLDNVNDLEEYNQAIKILHKTSF